MVTKKKVLSSRGAPAAQLLQPVEPGHDGLVLLLSHGYPSPPKKKAAAIKRANTALIVQLPQSDAAQRSILSVQGSRPRFPVSFPISVVLSLSLSFMFTCSSPISRLAP